MSAEIFTIEQVGLEQKDLTDLSEALFKTW